MKLDKILRVLVCLALVCCIVLNVAAMPARASSFGSWLLHQIGTDIGISGILEGLGLFRDSLNGDEYYNDLVSDVKNAAADAGLVSIDFMDVFYQADPLGVSSPLFAVPLTLISFVRNWVFDNGVVEVVPLLPVSNSFSDSTNNAISTASTKNYAILIQSDSVSPMVCYSDSPLFYYQLSDGSWVVDSPDASEFYYFSDSVGITWYKSTSYKYVEPGSVTYFGKCDPGVSTSLPVSLAVVSPPDRVFNVAYPQWLEHQRELEDGTTETLVQIGLGNTQAETESLTQEQIWSGQGTLQIPDQGQVNTPVTLPGWLQQGLDNLRLGLQDILSTLKQLPQLLAQELAKIFVPSQDYITVKVEALRGEFGFIDSVIATGQFIRDSVSGDSGPPVIYVDLGRAPSGNYGSQRVLLTDFSWYAPYKAQVDTVLSAALWAFFGWKVFLNLPSIIGGESGYISDIAFYESGGYYGGRAKEIRSGRSSRSKEKGGKG